MSDHRVLIVDDEPLLRDVLHVVLSDQYDAVAVSSGEEARQKIASGERFDVVLCDLYMEGVSGVALYHWLSLEHPDLCPRVLFMTGGAFSTEVVEFIRNVKNRVIEKPLSLDVIEDAIRAMVA
jgi:DNA-binding NtrC family response regulator